MNTEVHPLQAALGGRESSLAERYGASAPVTVTPSPRAASDSVSELDLWARGEELFNAGEPSVFLKREKPIHRQILFLYAEGKTQTEISELTGMGKSWISNVVKQPWFKKRLEMYLKEMHKDHVDVYLKQQVLPSIELLVEVRDNPTEKGPTRVSAANSLLDRYLGKAHTTVHVHKESTVKAEDERDQLDKDLEKTMTELKARGISLPSLGQN